MITFNYERAKIFLFAISTIVWLVGDVASAQWVMDGVALTDTVGVQLFPQLTTDGAGGAIVVWQDARGGEENRQYWDIYAQRIDSSGVIRWQRNGVPIAVLPEYQRYPRIVSDGEGGAIMAWDDFRNYFEGKVVDIYAQRINGEGQILWRENGIPVVTEVGEQSTIDMIPNGYGGAILVWADGRLEWPEIDIYAQRINSQGIAIWDSNGVAVCKAPGFQSIPRLVSDGAGGAIITWYDERESIDIPQIYTQRVDSTGRVLWQRDGILIGETRFWDFPEIANDGHGGAFIVWNQGGNSINLQRINREGQILWGENGVVIFPESIDAYPKVISDDEGNAIVVAFWHGKRGKRLHLWAQKVAPDGRFPWGEQGAPIDTVLAVSQYWVIGDGKKGVIVTWYSESSTDVYAQRVDSSGAVVWKNGAVNVCTAPSNQAYPSIIADGEGGAIIAWHDSRNLTQIYAQRVYKNGKVGGDTTSAVSEFRQDNLPHAFILEQNYPNPFNSATVISYYIPVNIAGDVYTSLKIFNLLGEELVTLVARKQPPGHYLVTWNGRDKYGKEVASGIYFFALKAGSFFQIRKMAFIK